MLQKAKAIYITVLPRQPFSALGPASFLKNHSHKLCMQVVRIVRSLTSAGPDDKLSHIENFRANEGWKFEYPSARVFHSHGSHPLRRSSRASLAGSRRSVPTWGLRVYNKSVIWFIERFLSRMQKSACIEVCYYAFDSRDILEAMNRWHVVHQLSNNSNHLKLSVK